MSKYLLLLFTLLLFSCGNKSQKSRQQIIIENKTIVQESIPVFNQLAQNKITAQQAGSLIRIKMDAFNGGMFDDLFGEDVNIVNNDEFKSYDQLITKLDSLWKNDLLKKIDFLKGFLNIHIQNEYNVNNSADYINQLIIKLKISNISEENILNFREEFFLINYLTDIKKTFNMLNPNSFKIDKSIYQYFYEIISNSKIKNSLKISRYIMLANLIDNDNILYALFSNYLIDYKVYSNTSYFEKISVNRIFKYLTFNMTNIESTIVNKNNIESLLAVQTQIAKMAIDSINRVTLNDSDELFKNFDILNTSLFFWDKQTALIADEDNKQQYLNLLDQRFVNLELYILEQFLSSDKKLSKKFNQLLLLSKLHPLLLNLVLNYQLFQNDNFENKIVDKFTRDLFAENTISKEVKIHNYESYLSNYYSVLIAKTKMLWMNKIIGITESNISPKQLKSLTNTSELIINLIQDNVHYRSKVKDIANNSISKKCFDHRCVNVLNSGIYKVSDILKINTNTIAHPLSLISIVNNITITIDLTYMANATFFVMPTELSRVDVDRIDNLSHGSAPSQNYSIVKTDNYICYDTWFGAAKECYGQDKYTHSFSVTAGSIPNKSHAGKNFTNVIENKLTILISNDRNLNNSAANLLLIMGNKGQDGARGLNSPLCSNDIYSSFYGRSGTTYTEGNNFSTRSHAENKLTPASFDISGGIGGDGGHGGDGVSVKITSALKEYDFIKYSVSNYGGGFGQGGATPICNSPQQASTIKRFIGKNGRSGVRGQIIFNEVKF